MSTRARALSSTSAWIGTGSFSVAVIAMAIDHLVGTEGEAEVLADPVMFAISVAISGVVALGIFAWVVPRAASTGPRRAARAGLVCAVASVIPGIALLWLGLPFVSAGAAVALGVESRRVERSWQSVAALAAGLAVTCLGLALYAYAVIT